jgi:hypothetical protein
MALSSAFSQPTRQGRAEHDLRSSGISSPVALPSLFFSRRERPGSVGLFQSRGIPDNENGCQLLRPQCAWFEKDRAIEERGYDDTPADCAVRRIYGAQIRTELELASPPERA